MRFLDLLSKKGQTAVNDPARWVWLAAGLFLLLGLLVQFWRLWSLSATYDQGIFNQVLWNSGHGRWFASSLSSQLSSAVLHGGLAPDPSYQRLGQHYTPLLLLWAPLVRWLGLAALPLVQVGLMTAAGLVLHRLALRLLPAGLAAAVACSFYGAQAVIGPTWCNFHDLCQLPLLVFLLLLGLLERRWWLLLLAALLIPLVREDTGVVLFGMALWMGLRRRAPWWVAALIGLWGAAWCVVVTSVLMPAVSADVSKRFMVENFGQYTPGAEELSSLEVLKGLLLQPWRLLWELINPPGKTLGYLAAQWLPLMFVPALSLDAWLLVALPLAGLLLGPGQQRSPLDQHPLCPAGGTRAVCRGGVLVAAAQSALCRAPLAAHLDRLRSALAAADPGKQPQPKPVVLGARQLCSLGACLAAAAVAPRSFGASGSGCDSP